MNRMNNRDHIPRHARKEGAALLIALGTIFVLSLIVTSFIFETGLEARLVSYSNKRFAAESLARSGIEYAQAILSQRDQASEGEIEDMGNDPDGFMQAALYVQRGLSTTSQIQLGDGTFSVTIEPADAGRNINVLSRQQWLEIFEMANVPSTDWDAMIDCLEDWIDTNENINLNGAESDDAYYLNQGYPVKNGPLDSVEELLFVKYWGPEILYGTSGESGSDSIYGIADILTVWGDGRVNINSASTNLLLSFVQYEDWELANVFEARAGEDAIMGTLDDGITSLAAVGADEVNFKLQSDFVKVTSIGESFGTRYRVECVLMLGSNGAITVYWSEGPVGKDANTR